MLTRFIVQIVDLSRRFALLVIMLALAITGFLGWYTATHFKINTDVNQLLSSDADWRKREKDLEKAFPQKNDLILVVIDGDSRDLAENGAASLAAKLSAMPEHFTYVQRPDAIPFFRTNGLLFLPKDELSGMLNQMVESQPLLGMLGSDPSLRGFFTTIGVMLQGVQYGQVDYSRLDVPLDKIADTTEAALSGQDKPLAWQSMMPEHEATLRDTRKFILAKPVLDFSALEPGAAASTIIRDTAKGLGLTPEHGVHVRLTGSVPLNDEEFGSVANANGFATIASGILVFVILLIALRSLRIIVPIILTLIVGLTSTTAFALMFVGSLNLISVAFAVMFIGIAVDFSIQFGVRYRDQHHREPDHNKAMLMTAAIIAVPLSMAAGSTALGFFAFIPTAYRGVSELGMIAGMGMLIAFALNITLLPALLSLTKPPAEAQAIGYRCMAPLDRFIQRHRKKIMAFALVLALAGLGIASQLRFDFDPLNLKDPHTESVSTLFDIMQDPDFNSYTIDLLRPTLREAQDMAALIDKLPEVDHTVTIASFVPDGQDAKLAMIADTNLVLGPTLDMQAVATPPTDDEIAESLQKTIEGLAAISDKHTSALRLQNVLTAALQKKDHGIFERMNKNLVGVLQSKLEQVKLALGATRITPESVTDDLRKDWVTPDGRYLLRVYPKGNPRDHKTLINFTRAVRAVAPDAAGAPISIQESGRTVTGAFIHAGIYALIAISLLAFLILRRVRDVLLMITPLVLAGILTLATMVLVGLPLNFANIIALPLLLSLGVSYAVYFVSYWRDGMANPLQSSMARAVLFSAATVLVAFSSLALSLHPGTNGMGKLLTVALLYSLSSTFFILPALCGPPKSDKQ